MKTNPEVMTAAAPQPETRPPFVCETSRSSNRERDDRAPCTATPRVSEDPMRRTDRYRLVVPWSDRV